MADPISRGYTGTSTIGNSAVFRRQSPDGAVCFSYHWDQVARFGKISVIREREWCTRIVKARCFVQA